MSARALMILGTASHVGKSILTAALGRILSDEGYRVAPFKAQNMSLNSAATPDGREIGRAQALQAEACRVPARVEMNPILIKPSTDTAAQVVVMGRVWGQVTAADYHRQRVEELFPIVVDAYETLAAAHDIILLEGAGSPAEINLKARDIVNMRMARAANAGCLLVGDIDRGGVFASLLGTVELLEPCERALLRGFIVNKFRGDAGLLQPGIDIISRRIQLPCAGVIPHLPGLGLDEEDSVALEDRPRADLWSRLPGNAGRPLRIGVLAFPYLANFTDFDPLAAEPSVSLAFLDRPEDLDRADLLILPGSKQTLDDLAWLRRSGFEPGICAFASRAPVVGICGGMQMLGRIIEDPTGAESGGTHAAKRGLEPFAAVAKGDCTRFALYGGSVEPIFILADEASSHNATVPDLPSARSAPGLNLLPIATTLRADKITRTARGRVHGSSLFGQPLAHSSFSGYEIHLGETIYAERAAPFAEIHRDGEAVSHSDGAVQGNVFGTYIHGLFADDDFRHSFLAAARAARGLAPPRDLANVTAEREARIDRLAAHVRAALDMNLIRSCIAQTSSCPT